MTTWDLGCGRLKRQASLSSKRRCEMKDVRLLDISKLLVSIAICQVAGLIGSVFTAPSIPTWYATLKKPWFTPPNWVFAPVWLTLFLLMGIAVFLVWRKGLRDRRVKMALAVFTVQLIVNVLWSVVFFGFKSPLAGLIVIVILWVAILLTLLYFFKVSRLTGFLLVPYIAWVSLALALNTSILILNL